MKSLKTLIKLNQFKLEEQRLVLKSFYEKRQGLTDHKAKIEHGLSEAKQNYSAELHADDEMVMTGTIQQFIQRSLSIINDLRVAISYLDKDIAKEQDKLKEIFAEVKKFEITEENRIKAEKELAQKKEQQTLDELSNQKYVFDKRQ